MYGSERGALGNQRPYRDLCSSKDVMVAILLKTVRDFDKTEIK
jgi:hypothetical protein